MNIQKKDRFHCHSMTAACILLAALLCLGSVQALFLIAYDTNETYPTVDLGYSVYRGYHDKAQQLNSFNGIRYAAPPIGALRWQKPQEPEPNRKHILSAVDYGPICPQSYQGPTPQPWFFFPSEIVNEDCLYLNVLSPSNATNLPVLVWIHGGGYGLGNGRYNFTELLTTNSRSFIVVTLQYRLGAFGFMSSSELANYGVPNAGLHDQHFALEWVHKYISKFGGDPNRVTIAGESAGAGSVLQQTLAYGGKEGTKYFTNAIVASPYLPPQWQYNGEQPTKAYDTFVKQVGCTTSHENFTVFDCLRLKDTYSLQNASAYVSTSANYGQWAFIPVVDGSFIQKSPQQQLHAGDVNGLRMLSGHNSDEAPAFVPQNITTTSDFEQYLNSLNPTLDHHMRAKISRVYAIPRTTPGPLFSTTGSSDPSALNQSTFAIGQQQRANNLYAEKTFVCPGYWLADTFSLGGRKSWKYQFSVVPAAHGTDLNAYYKSNTAIFSEGTLSAGFRTGMQLVWGRFTIYGDPTLSEPILDTTISENKDAIKEDLSAAKNSSWLPWNLKSMRMMNFNVSGGAEKVMDIWIAAGRSVKVTLHVEPGLMANWTVSDASHWENGRARRCNLWADVGRFHS